MIGHLNVFYHMSKTTSNLICYNVKWGNLFEPVSIQIYEIVNSTTVEDFGCITHHEIDYIAASPDGINIELNSNRFGRMLEIKNIVNREITGIPKTEYWALHILHYIKVM